MGYVYLIKDLYNNTYKIGVAKDVTRRMKSLQTGNVSPLKLIWDFKTDYPYRLEGMLHKTLQEYREHNEWFGLPEAIIDDFPNMCERINNIIISLKDNPYFSKNLK